MLARVQEGEYWDILEKFCDIGKLQNWRVRLSEFGNLEGWECERYEGRKKGSSEISPKRPSCTILKGEI